MFFKEYTPIQIEQAKRYISCDALFILVMNALARKEPFSVVRMGDGEASILRMRTGGPMAKHLVNKDWLKEYGLLGADMKILMAQLWLATEHSDVYCPNISGLCLTKYEIISLGKQREMYGEGLFAHTWLYMGRVEELMLYEGRIGVVCRNSKDISMRLFNKYSKPDIEASEYNSWTDYYKCLDEIGKMKSHLILVSAGPSGKYLCVEASKKFGKVVLDTGSALIRHWSVSKVKNF